MTPAGYAARMRAELHQLMRVERPKIVEIVHWAAGNGDRSENGDYLYGKKRLREIDKRRGSWASGWRSPRWSIRRRRPRWTGYFLVQR